MKKILLILALFLFTGCSLDQLFVYNELNKVYVVKYSAYLKYHRGYFTRTDLLPLFGKQKYLFLYNQKYDDLGFLIHHGSRYLLYSVSHPDRTPISVSDNRIKSRASLLRTYAKYGYSRQDPLKIGYLVSVKHRVYKGVKTYMVESKNYRKLWLLYRDAITHYDPSKIQSVHISLPKALIEPYLIRQYHAARTTQEHRALEQIAKTLNITLSTEAYRFLKDMSAHKKLPARYPYYLHVANIHELEVYLNNQENRDRLTPGQSALLEYRLKHLRQQKLMKEGTLEELIDAYHRNKDPNLKQRIMERIKEIRGY